MFVITNRNLEDGTGLKQFGKKPNKEGPKEIRILEVNRKGKSWTVKPVRDRLPAPTARRLITKYSLLAKEQGKLKLTCVGTGKVGDRPTYVYERTLPYTGEGGEWPDRVLIYHLDAETLLPLSCASYADDAKQKLLGKYEYTDVKLNVGLTEADFDGKTYGM